MKDSIVAMLLLLVLTLISCDNYDLKIDPEFRTAINSYKTNDTIYFQSVQNSSEYDTIRITGVDSIRQYPVISDVHPMKEIRLRIEHLPIDIWKEEKIAGINEESYNQKMITISNAFEDCCQIRINFREFNGSVSESNVNGIDTLRRDSPIKVKDDYITELFWSNKNGIKGYKKQNGQTYRRITHHNNVYKK
jgi:hypothetical protein